MWDHEWLPCCLGQGTIRDFPPEAALREGGFWLCCCCLDCLHSLDSSREFKHLGEGSGMKTLEWGPAMGRSPASLFSWGARCSLRGIQGKAGADPAGVKPWWAKAQPRDLLRLLLPLCTQQSSPDPPELTTDVFLCAILNSGSFNEAVKFISRIIN